MGPFQVKLYFYTVLKMFREEVERKGALGSRKRVLTTKRRGFSCLFRGRLHFISQDVSCCLWFLESTVLYCAK